MPACPYRNPGVGALDITLGFMPSGWDGPRQSPRPGSHSWQRRGCFPAYKILQDDFDRVLILQSPCTNGPRASNPAGTLRSLQSCSRPSNVYRHLVFSCTQRIVGLSDGGWPHSISHFRSTATSDARTLLERLIESGTQTRRPGSHSPAPCQILVTGKQCKRDEGPAFKTAKAQSI